MIAYLRRYLLNCGRNNGYEITNAQHAFTGWKNKLQKLRKFAGKP